MVAIRGGFRGAGDGGCPPRDSTPSRPKGSPLCYFLRNPFLSTDPKFFLKAPLAPMYTNFEGEHAPKKRNFLSNFFKKCLKTAFWPFFFRNDVFWPALGRELGKSNWSTSKNKKRSSKFSKIFWKSAPPPSKRILDPPLVAIQCKITFLNTSFASIIEI